MSDRDTAVREAARQHGLSQSAAEALWDALMRGGGRQAQFSHPDLGGMGQWSDGGMVQIGDMFNNDLKARVAAACADLSARMGRSGSSEPGSSASQHQGSGAEQGGTRSGTSGAQQTAQHRDWWPEDLGHPSTSGSQDAMRYAYFPDRRRLAIERNGRLTVYDTGGHRISGVSQGQSRAGDLAFTSQDGPVDLGSLRVVER